MSEKKHDVQNLKEVVVLLIKTGGATKKSFEDGSFNATDITNYLTVLPLLQPALEGITEIPAEIKDMDATEGQELLDLVAKDIGELANAPKLVTQINAGLKLVKVAKEFYETVK